MWHRHRNVVMNFTARGKEDGRKIFVFQAMLEIFERLNAIGFFVSVSDSKGSEEIVRYSEGSYMMSGRSTVLTMLEGPFRCSAFESIFRERRLVALIINDDFV